MQVFVHRDSCKLDRNTLEKKKKGFRGEALLSTIQLREGMRMEPFMSIALAEPQL